MAWIPGELPTLYASPPAPWAIPNLSALPMFAQPEVGWASTSPSPGACWTSSVGGVWTTTKFLQQLEPLSANHTQGDPPMGGTYIFLSSVQAELLGLDSQALTLMPFQSPPTSPTGGPPTNALGSAFGDIVGAFQFAYNALVTTANFIANLPQELEALGQFILGALEKVLSAVEAAVQWLANALDILVQLIQALAQAVANGLVSLIKDFVTTVTAPFVLPMLSMAADTQVNGNYALSQQGFQDTYTHLTGDSSPQTIQSTGTADSNLAEQIDGLVAIGIGLVIGLAIANYVFDAMSAGAYVVAEKNVMTVSNKLAVNELPTLLLKVVSGAVAASLVAAIIAGDSSQENTYLRDAGFSASLATLAVSVISAMMVFTNSFKYLHTPVKTGVTYAFAIAIVGAISAAIINALEWVESNFGLNLNDAIFFFGILNMIWGSLGLSFSFSLQAQIIAFAENADPVNPLAIVVSLFDFGTGAYGAIQSGG